MMYAFNQKRITLQWVSSLLSIIVLLLLLGYSSLSISVAPLVGTKILNQASASFVDSNGLIKIASTNEVVLTVTQIYSATLSQDRSLLGAIGSNIIFHHTLTNTGNGADVFHVSYAQLTAASTPSDQNDFDSVTVIFDANNNGQVDNGEIDLSAITPASALMTLNANESIGLIVTGAVPASAINATILGLKLTVQAENGTGVAQVNSVNDESNATGGLDGANDTNDDRVYLLNIPVISVTKSSEYSDNNTSNDLTDDYITYRVVVENIGTIDATNLTVVDYIPSNTTWDLQAVPTFVESGSSFNAGPTYLTAAGTGGFIYTVISTAIPNVPQAFYYIVDVDDGLAEGTEIINGVQNTSVDAIYGNCYANATNATTKVYCNTTIDTVPGLYGVTITDTGTGSNNGVNDGGDDDVSNPTKNDNQKVDVIERSGSVIFTHIVTNTSNGSDIFNLSTSDGSFPFPSDTRFEFYYADQYTPLVDSDQDGQPDTGPLAANASMTIVVRAVLPQTLTGNNGGNGYNVTVTATSSADNTVSDTTTASLGEILVSNVDIANDTNGDGNVDVNDGGTDPTGFGDDGTINAHPATSLTTNKNILPGGTVIFDLIVANEGPDVDAYAITAWADAAASVALPADWIITFTDTSGNIITDTPDLASGGNAGATFAFTASITIPNNATAATQPIFFKVYSSVSLISDIKQDQVTIGEVEELLLTPDGSSTISPCASAEYLHSITNKGNVAEDILISSTETILSHLLQLPTTFDGANPSGYTGLQDLSVGDTIIVWDDSSSAWVNRTLIAGTGALPLHIAIPLDRNDATRIKVQVFSSCSTPEYTEDRVTLTATVLNGSVSVNNDDLTRVSSGFLVITKLGAADVDCDGTHEGSFSDANIKISPNECVIWQLTVINQGVTTVCNVELHDSAPVFTTLNTPNGNPIIFSQPAPGDCACSAISGSNINCEVGNNINGKVCCLQSGESAVVRFGVKVE